MSWPTSSASCRVTPRPTPSISITANTGSPSSFFSVSASGAYTTIVPPAGALVSSLPDDYETIVLDGIEYYMVDNTVYRTTLFDGQPYLEVLGQMYGSMYNQYSLYR